MKLLKINWQQAATEFVVIVVGVLAALAVDQWRDEHEDRKIEAEYLSRLRTDIEADIENFYRFEQILETKARFLQSLLDDATSSEFDSDPDSLMEAVNYSSFIALPDSVSTTFDELQSTGRLALIQDLAQRDALSKYYSGFEHISAILSQPLGDYRQILWGTVPGAVNRDWRLSNSVSGIDELRQSLELLRKNPELPAAVNNEISYAAAMQYYLAMYRNRAEKLLEILNQ